MYSLVQIQQIPLAEWKQRSERLRNVTVIVSETPAFFQARLPNRCWLPTACPDCPGTPRAALSRAGVCARGTSCYFIPYWWFTWHGNTEISRMDTHHSLPHWSCPFRSSRSCSWTSPPKQTTCFCQPISFVQNGAPPAAIKGVWCPGREKEQQETIIFSLSWAATAGGYLRMLTCSLGTSAEISIQGSVLRHPFHLQTLSWWMHTSIFWNNNS